MFNLIFRTTVNTGKRKIFSYSNQVILQFCFQHITAHAITILTAIEHPIMEKWSVEQQHNNINQSSNRYICIITYSCILKIKHYQWNEDGIIQTVLSSVVVRNVMFVSNFWECCNFMTATTNNLPTFDISWDYDISVIPHQISNSRLSQRAPPLTIDIFCGICIIFKYINNGKYLEHEFACVLSQTIAFLSSLFRPYRLTLFS